MIIFKNIFSFALTFKAFQWLVASSTQATPLFNILASIQVVACVLSIPMCKSFFFFSTLGPLVTSEWRFSTDLAVCSDVFGKRIRSFFHRHDLLEIFKVR